MKNKKILYKKNIWNFWADKYERLYVQKYSLGPTREKVLLELKKIIIKDKKYDIIDFGCGTGQLLRDIQKSFSKNNLNLFGIDISEKMIEVAKENSNDINFIVSDAKTNFGFKKKYDIIVCTHSFPYYSNQDMVLKKIHTFLKEDGYFLICHGSTNNHYDKLILSFIKLTTTRSHYPSDKEMIKLLTSNKFKLITKIKIKKYFFTPNIILYVAKNENITYKT